MSLKTKFFSALTLAIAVAAFSTFTFAQDDKATTPGPDKEKAEKSFHGGHNGGHKGGRGEFGGHRGGMRGMGMVRMMHELNLSDAQKTQIHSIMDANKPDKATMEEMHTLAQAKHQGTITADQQTRLDTLREQGKAKMKSVHEQIQNVLTAEQKAQIEQKKAEMKQRREEFRQKREQNRQNRTPAPAATTDTPKVN